MRTCQQPTAIYLGRQQWQELRDEADRVCCYKVEPATRPDGARAAYRGVSAFEVDTPWHLAVS